MYTYTYIYMFIYIHIYVNKYAMAKVCHMATGLRPCSNMYVCVYVCVCVCVCVLCTMVQVGHDLVTALSSCHVSSNVCMVWPLKLCLNASANEERNGVLLEHVSRSLRCVLRSQNRKKIFPASWTATTSNRCDRDSD